MGNISKYKLLDRTSPIFNVLYICRINIILKICFDPLTKKIYFPQLLQDNSQVPQKQKAQRELLLAWPLKRILLVRVSWLFRRLILKCFKARSEDYRKPVKIRGKRLGLPLRPRINWRIRLRFLTCRRIIWMLKIRGLELNLMMSSLKWGMYKINLINKFQSSIPSKIRTLLYKLKQNNKEKIHKNGKKIILLYRPLKLHFKHKSSSWRERSEHGETNVHWEIIKFSI